MKTRDGHELKIGHYYYLENGQCVNLYDFAETPDGEQRFIVTPFYEGETMTASGDGGSHCEYTAEYEHEGEPVMVPSLFDKAPTEKVCSRYKSYADKIEHLCLSIGVLKKTENDLGKSCRTLDLQAGILQKEHQKTSEEITTAKATLNGVVEETLKARQTLIEAEDSITDMRVRAEISAISTAELQRLNKRDFELQCLEHGGVDNWGWYSESLTDFHKRYPEG